MADSQLARLAIIISANVSGLASGLKSAQSQLKDFTSGITKVGSSIIASFAVQRVAAFAFEISKLAGEAEGVKAAFDKLPSSVALMEDLKNATSGTVSELDLMKRTVQAANFGISLEALPKLLEFAAVRAQQTGQSVDYLVDSIVTGIGRKSPLILDNLGISAVALKEKMGGVALATADIGTVAEAVGRIASDELEKMGDLAETTAVKTQRLTASWEDFKVAAGNAINQTGVLDKTLNGLTNTLNAVSGDEFTTGMNQLLASMGKGSEILDRFAASGGKIDLSWQELMARGFVRSEEAAKKYEKILAKIAEDQKNLKLASGSVDPLSGLPTTGGKPFIKEESFIPKKTLESLREQLKGLNDDYEALEITDKKRLVSTGQDIIAISKQIEELEKLRKAQKDVNDTFSPDTIEDYQDKIADLNKELAQTNVHDLEKIRVLSAQVAGYQEAIEKVEALKRSFQDLDGLTLDLPDTSALFDSEQSQEEINERFSEQMQGLVDTANSTSDQIAESLKKIDPSNLTAQFEQLGGMIVQSFAQSAQAGESFGDAMKRVAKTVIASFLARALAAAITKSFETAKNPIIGAVLAGASTAAVFALFNAIPGGKSGGGGGGASVSAGNVQRVQSTAGQSIAFNAEFTIHGNDLKAIANNQANRGGRLGG